ncbi:hypothetical protein McanCB56680_006628 [Microsporum canis]
MPSTRLRKTFKYPDSQSDDDTRPELDEQEQEALIETLRKDNEAGNAFYQVFDSLSLNYTAQGVNGNHSFSYL